MGIGGKIVLVYTWPRLTGPEKRVISVNKSEGRNWFKSPLGTSFTHNAKCRVVCSINTIGAALLNDTPKESTLNGLGTKKAKLTTLIGDPVMSIIMSGDIMGISDTELPKPTNPAVPSSCSIWWVILIGDPEAKITRDPDGAFPVGPIFPGRPDISS